jgi:hypothetical protein
MDACVCQCLKWVSFSSLRRPFFFLSLLRRFCQRQLASKSVSDAELVLIKQLFLSFHATIALASAKSQQEVVNIKTFLLDIHSMFLCWSFNIKKLTTDSEWKCVSRMRIKRKTPRWSKRMCAYESVRVCVYVTACSCVWQRERGRWLWYSITWQASDTRFVCRVQISGIAIKKMEATLGFCLVVFCFLRSTKTLILEKLFLRQFEDLFCQRYATNCDLESYYLVEGT